MKKIALITGASSGLGAEYIRRLDTAVDEIWAIARRRERLEALGKETGTAVRPIPMDLTRPESIEKLHALLEEEQPDIRLLINAAGFGKIGNYREVALDEINRMIDLNCRAAVDVTLLCLPYMRRGSRILEICSTAAFQPFPHLNVYAASKAFLYRFTRALRMELWPGGIHVTAVCPYWIKDTEFIPVAKQTEGSGQIRHFPLAQHKAAVVRRSLRASRIGLPVSTPGPVCLVHRIVAKVVPSELMMGIWELIRRV